MRATKKETVRRKERLGSGRASMLALTLALAVVGGTAVAAEGPRETFQRLYESGHYGEAVAPARRVLVDLERRFGRLHDSALSFRATLVGLYRFQGNYEEAAALLRDEIGDLERAHGPNAPRLARSLNRLAGIYRKLGKPAAADTALRRALAIYTRSRTANGAGRQPAPPKLAKLAPHAVAKRVAPAPLPVRAPLRALPATSRAEALDWAARLDAEAEILWWEGRPLEVEERYRAALDLREAALGRETIEVAENLAKLARIYWAVRRDREAAVLHHESLAIKSRILPKQNGRLAEDYWELATIYNIRGEYDAARPLMARAISVWRRALTADDPRLIEARRSYDILLQELGRAPKSKPVKRRRPRVVRARAAPG